MKRAFKGSCPLARPCAFLLMAALGFLISTACSSPPKALPPEPAPPAPQAAPAPQQAVPGPQAKPAPPAPVPPSPQAKPASPPLSPVPSGPELALAQPKPQKPPKPDGLAPPPPAQESLWLKATLASLTAKDLPGGARLLLRRLPGRSLAACELSIVGAASLSAPGKEGSIALGLALLSRGGDGMAPGELRRRIDAAGGRLELRELSYDGLALELVAPPALLPGLLDALLAAMAKPAFASPDFPAEEWDGAMRDFRVRLMKDYGDPAVQASTAIRSEVYPGHPYAVPPLGTAQSLLSLTRAELASQWKALVGSERIVIAVAGDLDPEALAAMAAPRMANLGRRGSDPVPPPPMSIKDALILIPRSGASGSYLKVEYPAPPLSSPDYPALLVGLSALQDLVLEEVRGGDPQAYGVATRLSASASPTASIQVSRGKDGGRAKAAVERAVRLLASGASLSTTGAGLSPLKDSLEAYKLGALSRTYSRADSAADLALRMARDLCAGGDGSTWFRLADRIGAVRAEDIQRVVRERLVEGPKAWAIAGPPSLLAELKAVPVSAAKP